MPFLQTKRFARASRVLACCGAVGIAAGCAADRPAPMWKGSTSVVDGIEFVSNPDQPVFGDADIDLTELWRVRPGISDSLMWTDPTRLLATNGGVYVLDPPSSSIAVISPTGEYQFSFGGSGMGPGELRNPGALAVVDGTIAVLNGGNGRIEFFTPAGKYSHSKRLPGPTFSMLALNPGTLLVNSLRGDTAVWMTTSSSADADDNACSFGSLPAADSLFSGCDRVGTVRNGNVLRLRCTAPVITTFDSAGEPRLVFRIARAPTVASEEQLARLETLLSAGYQQAGFEPEAAKMFVRRQVERQRVLHAYRKVFGNENVILIWEQVPPDLGNSPATLHVFNARGVYLGRAGFHAPWTDADIIGNRLYALELDPETDLASLIAYEFRFSVAANRWFDPVD